MHSDIYNQSHRYFATSSLYCNATLFTFEVGCAFHAQCFVPCFHVVGVAAVLHGIYADQRRRHQAIRNPQTSSNHLKPTSSTAPRPRGSSRGKIENLKKSHTNPHSDSKALLSHATVPARKSPHSATPRSKIPPTLLNSTSASKVDTSSSAPPRKSHNPISVDLDKHSSSAPDLRENQKASRSLRTQGSFTYSKARSRDVDRSYRGLSDSISPARSRDSRPKSSSKSGFHTVGKMDSFTRGEIPLMSALQDPADLFMHPPDLFPEVRVPSLGETSIYHIPDAEDSQYV